jgi:drug/metabolite transporter (DMT)-like permease
VIGNLELGAIFFGLLSAASYGVGDFSGGMATRRIPVMSVIAVAHGIGLVFLILMAIVTRETIPPTVDFVWGVVSGLAGLVGLSALYRGLALGRAGVVAPIAGVLSAGLPVVVAFLTLGAPGQTQIIGFLIGLVSVWLVSGGEFRTGHVPGMGLAFLAGIGFGVYYVLLGQIGETALFWPLAAGRAASFSIMLVAAMRTGKGWFPRDPRTLFMILLIGLLDVGGNIFFVLAERTGRLDIASVVSSLYPAVTILLAWVILREKLSRIQIIGVLAALVAIALIAIPTGGAA